LKSKFYYKLLFEAIGILFAIVLSLLVITPFKYYNVDFPFLFKNALLVFIAVTFIRWQFFIKKSLFAQSKIVHGILFFISLYSIIYFIGIFGQFKFFYEELNLSQFASHLSFKESTLFRKYMKTEFMFFSVLAIISSMFFCIRLLQSVWRIMNTKP